MYFITGNIAHRLCYIAEMRFTPSRRIQAVPPSFLREIFKLIADPRIISFATGLPNPTLFPTDAFKEAADRTLEEAPGEALQYGTSIGLPELRTLIAESYVRKDKIDVSADQILITNGSQQGLELLGKVLINEGDSVAVEMPTYLAAIQAFSVYEPRFVGVPLEAEGMSIPHLTEALRKEPPKLLYTIPNFQNPTGITTSDKVRQAVSAAINGTDVILIEDDPYGEIRFEGERQRTYASMIENVVMLGSFSKIVAPGLRLGWMVVRDPGLYRLLETAKQAEDLHTSTFIQHVVYRYYRDNDSDEHVAVIAAAYRKQKDAMIAALQEQFGGTITYTKPEGGMFIWATFPEHVDTSTLFTLALEEGVAFVPGESFYTDSAQKNTMRLNFSNASVEHITEGMQRLKRAVNRYESRT
jgi:2-aminoadipate transaminase